MNSHAHDEMLSALRVAVNSDHRRRQRTMRAAIAVSVLAFCNGSGVLCAIARPSSTLHTPLVTRAPTNEDGRLRARLLTDA